MFTNFLIFFNIFFGTAIADFPVDEGPLRFSDSQMLVIDEIARLAEWYHADPYEMIAIGWVESRLNPNAANRDKDAGVFQVNCKIHWKKFGYHKPFRHLKSKRKMRREAIKNCVEAQKIIEENIGNSVFLLKSMERKYRGCRGENRWACYNGGPGWRVKHKERATKYKSKVKKIKRILEKHYKVLIEGSGC